MISGTNCDRSGWKEEGGEKRLKCSFYLLVTGMTFYFRVLINSYFYFDIADCGVGQQTAALTIDGVLVKCRCDRLHVNVNFELLEVTHLFILNDDDECTNTYHLGMG